MTLHTRSDGRAGEAGFALILAVLALLLLTSLGLTLANTTSTELQIATNYRWSRQAYYNAEAGIEAGKRLLQTLDWATVLPTPRAASWTLASGLSQAPPLPRYSGASRDGEHGGCDSRGGRAGYGIVLNDGTQAYENVSSIFGQSLNGTFTLWVRRTTATDGSGLNISDYGADAGELILVAEGTAPHRGAVGSDGVAQASRAVRLLEVVVARRISGECKAYAGQKGTSSEGSNFGACGELGDDSLTAAFGSGITERNASQK